MYNDTSLNGPTSKKSPSVKTQKTDLDANYNFEKHTKPLKPKDTVMNSKLKRMFTYGAVLFLSALVFHASAADLYVSITNGNNKNPGTKDAPLKNLWKAIEKAGNGDTIHVAKGNYPGKMSCGWVELNKPLSLIGGYTPDFATRDPLVNQTMFQPKNEQNATKPSFGTLTIKTRTFGATAKVIL